MDVTIEGAEEDEEEEEISELWDTWDGELSLPRPDVQMRDERRKEAANRPKSSQVGGPPGPGSAGGTAAV